MSAPEPHPPFPTTRLAGLEAGGRLRAIGHAADRLDDGHLLVGPTELGYAALATPPVCALALPALVDPAHAADSLRAPAWWCPDARALFELAPSITAMQRRVLMRLPVGLLLVRVGLEPDALAALLARLGLPAGLVDDTRHIRVRLGDAEALSRVAELHRAAREAPLALAPLMDPAGRPAADAASAAAAIEAARAEHSAPAGVHLLDAGEPPGATLRHAPTVLDLNAAGGVHVPVEGAYSRRFILSQAGLTILFVCTGNTCRSPMAEAIAAAMLDRQETGAPVKVLSAGVGAGPGAPPTPEAVDALRELGYPAPRHASRPLTPQLLAQADVVYTMTGSHARSVHAISPGANVSTLDPDGHDIPDPIGGPASLYLQTAKRLEDLIAKRLKELHL